MYASISTSCDADRNATTTAAIARRPGLEQRIERAHHRDRGQQRELEHEQEAAPPAEERQPEAIEQRRPHELERVGEADQRERGDLLERRLDRLHPRAQQLPGQQQRQPARQPEQEQHAHPA
ncbi:MAG: hypothetical protein WKF78_04575 [Candidatus Limnocylindrales bacterium]